MSRCANLPGDEDLVAQVAPELAQVSVRELPEQTALDVFGRAAAGWGSVDVLTQDVFRQPCTVYFSREALRAVDAAFELDLVTVIRGQDRWARRARTRPGSRLPKAPPYKIDDRSRRTDDVLDTTVCAKVLCLP